MKILLMQPPWFRLQNASLVNYPVGPTYIAAALEKAGYDSLVWNVDYSPGEATTIGGTNILDTEELTRNYSIYKNNLSDLSSSIWSEIRDMLKEYNPDIVGISVYSSAYKSALNVARIIKNFNPKIITIFGGIHPTIAPDEVAMNPTVDFVVRGEGEETIQELVKAIDAKSDYTKIKGIAYKQNGDVIQTPSRDYIPDLDDIGFPARHKIFEKDTFPPSAFQAIYGSRGCPFKCIFCGSFNLWGHNVRTRSAESLVAEIEETNKKYKTRYFYICDDVFFITRKRALEFCRLLLDKKLKIIWSAQTRAEIVDDELLMMMKKSGGQHVAIGIETGDERIRELIKKGNTLDDVRRAAKLIKKHGLNLVGFFMFGFPWETKEDINRTVNFLKEINPTFAFPYIVTPAPGTELAKLAGDMGLIGPDSELEDFYHESPQMCLSVNIPKDERKDVIDRVLGIFCAHNRANLFKDVLKRPYFYYTLMQDHRMLRNPFILMKHIKNIIQK